MVEPRFVESNGRSTVVDRILAFDDADADADDDDDADGSGSGSVLRPAATG